MNICSDVCPNRVRTGHEKHGKSQNLGFQFPGLKSHGILVKVMESHGKAIYMLSKNKKGKKIRNLKNNSKSEKGVNFSRTE